MNKRNYQKELEQILACMEQDRWGAGGEGEKKPPRLLLHSCCAPCSSYVLEYLSVYFQVTVFYYNPNISFEEEYQKRVKEQIRLIDAFNEEGGRYPIDVLQGDYEPEEFFRLAKGLEDCPEGGERCFCCYRQRLGRTARQAKAGDYDAFATTLTVSPLKDAQKLNEIGFDLAKEYGVRWLPSDFKKKDGYKRSIELSAKYGLYRQDYCGCAYSKAEREKAREKNREKTCHKNEKSC